MPEILSDVMFRLRAIFRTGEMEHDLDEELRFHFDYQVELHMQHGLTRSEAQRRARMEFGVTERVREETRDSHGVAWFESVMRDIQYAFRTLRKNPAFTAVAVLSLALGIGANTALFQMIDAIRLRTLPVTAPWELAQIQIADMTKARGSFERDNALTYGIWEQIRAKQQGYSSLFAWSGDEFNLSPSGEVRMERGLWVSGDFFRGLAIEPALGRLFTAADDRPGCGTPGAVLSYSFWQNHFGAEPSVIGHKITLNGHPVEVIGVTRAGFHGLEPGLTFQIAVPLCSSPVIAGFDVLHAGTFWCLTVMGRMQPGWSVQRSSMQLDAVSRATFAESLPPNYPPDYVKDYRAMKLKAVPAGTGISGLRNQYSEALWLLLGLAGLVLLVSCANLANLLLARASAREREIAVRLAIGASRRRLIRQLMTESLLIAVAGAAAALLLARVFGLMLVSLLSASQGQLYVDLVPGWRVLLFTAGLALVTCLLFGLAPAMQATRIGPGGVLKASSRGLTATFGKLGLRRTLVVVQIALSLVLVAGALLFVRTFQNLIATRTGFQQDGILIADLRYARADTAGLNVYAFQQNLLGHVRAVPGVVAATDTNIVPVGGTSSQNRVWMDGADSSQGVDTYISLISPGYFHTLKVPLLDGRDIDEHDSLTSRRVAIVNAAFARQVAHSANPVGRRLRIEATPSEPETAYEIVGLVADTKYRDLREAPLPIAYLALAQDAHPTLSDQLLIRSDIALAVLAPAIRRAIATADPNAKFELREFRTQILDSLMRERLMASLSSGFGVLAAALSAMGLYGVMSFLAARRRNEIGVRLALGADRHRIVGMMLSETMRLLTLGLAAGAALFLVAATLARSLLFGLAPYDPLSVLVAATLLAFAALAASYFPARRAARLDPMMALREE